MKTPLITVLLLMGICHAAFAQTPHLVCGFEHFYKIKKLHDREWCDAYDQVFAHAKTTQDNRGGGAYTLPVVFHVVYNTEAQNVPDSVIYSQIDVLNEDYRRLNEDAINTRDIFLPFAADCEIQFVLANTDPNGNPTSGITRHNTNRTDFMLDVFSATNTLDEVKHDATDGVDAWDTDHYINVWICNVSVNIPGAQIFGLSYPPAGLSNWPAGSTPEDPNDQGIVLHYTVVGRNNPAANDDGTAVNNKGRALTHEMGHYLGLRHTWADEFFGDVCADDDGIADTPTCGSGDQFACDQTANTCDDGAGDFPDMIENFMDYTKDECYNMFTNDQKNLMRYVLENLRNDLLTGVGVTEIKTTSIKIWPNPADETIQIDPAYLRSAYSIHSTEGKFVCSGILHQNTVDIASLDTGIYYLTIEQSDKRYHSSFIVR